MRLGFTVAGLEVLRRQVRSHDLGAGLGRPNRRIAGAGGDVEHALACRDLTRPYQHFAELPDRRLREAVVVAKRPSRAGGGVGVPTLHSRRP
jgi:hypothetical protein